MANWKKSILRNYFVVSVAKTVKIIVVENKINRGASFDWLAAQDATNISLCKDFVN